MTTVSDVMSKGLLTVEASATLVEAASQMDERRVGAALVVDGGRLAGILTERDLLRAVARGAVADANVDAWMTRDPETIDPDEPTGRAAAIMIHGGFRHLPVVEGRELIGIVSIRDLMRAVIDDEAPRGV
jgi:CBS domain-containing protein